MSKKIGVLIQARLNSSRLPGKMFFPIYGLPLISRSMIAVKKISVDEYVISCPISDEKVFSPFAEQLGFKVISGSETNVVERITKAVEALKLDVVVHITGDKAFLSAKYTQLSLDHYLSHTCDLVSYEESPLKETTGAIYYPSILVEALHNPKTTLHQLEHVKPCFTENKYLKHCKMSVPEHLKKIKDFTFMLDTDDDYLKILEEYQMMYPKWPIEIDDIASKFI
jgi:spore coat polysaccharide biosynthesis protein SpsF